jgi:DNA-binding MarR family transcriptional regulator
MAEEIKNVTGLDRVLHEPARMLIAALLYPTEGADFTYLLRETGLTKGNLSAHLSKLETAGYVQIDKAFRGKYPHTVIVLTDDGRKAFQQYRAQLKRTVDSLPGD